MYSTSLAPPKTKLPDDVNVWYAYPPDVTFVPPVVAVTTVTLIAADTRPASF